MTNRTDALQELLEDPRFIAWVTGNADDLEDYWNNWVADNLARRETLDQARSLVKAMEGKPIPVSDTQIKRSVERALQEAKRQEIAQPKRKQPVIIRPLYQRWWAVAASILLVIGLGWWAFTTRTPRSIYDQQVAQVNHPGRLMIEVKNDTRPIQHVQLPDGSSVLLQKNSRISFPQQFRPDKREIYLTGEAFFEVMKNPAQPFLVYADELVTKVLGTSFGVKAYANEPAITVVVKTGKVSVFTQSDRQFTRLESSRTLTGLVLSPNEQVTYERKESRLTRALVEKPTLLNIPIEKQLFIYQETPIATVFADLQKAYDVDIVFDADVMAHCSITATLGDDPLIQKLTWICRVLEASYELKDGRIIVSGKSCQ
jgi:transmembrane sensor